MTKSKEMCSGCHYDFYNGHNDMGVKECWNFESAQVVERVHVGIWQNPPYEWRPRDVLSCYHPDWAAMLSRDDPRVVDEKVAAGG